MPKLVLVAIVLGLIYYLIARTGSQDAALWLTGAVGCFTFVCYGLSRA